MMWFSGDFWDGDTWLQEWFDNEEVITWYVELALKFG